MNTYATHINRQGLISPAPIINGFYSGFILAFVIFKRLSKIEAMDGKVTRKRKS